MGVKSSSPISNKCIYGLGFLGSCCSFTSLLLIIGAVTLKLVFPGILEKQVTDIVPLQVGSPTLQQLQNPGVPLYKDIHFFNLTNPQDFESGAKPVLVEVGPYSYMETRVKTVLNISSDGELLTYNQTRVFKFNQATTRYGLKETDIICTINLALVAAVNQLEDAMKENNFIVNTFGDHVLRAIFDLTNAKLYVCQPSTALAWNYSDPLIQALNTNTILRATGMNYPRRFVNLQINNSINDSFPSVIHTGVKDVKTIGKFEQWKGNLGSLNIWPNGMGANALNGTEGLVFSPFLRENDTLEVFSDDAFRTFKLVHTDTLELMGIRVFRYEVMNSTYESAFVNPDNERWGSWNPDGLFYLGPTQDPIVPVFGSKPHFLDGDPVLREKMEGLVPNRTQHETVLHVDPLTGANVQFSLRIQINIQINQSSNYRQLQYINGTVYYPVLYINEHSVLTPEFADFLLASGLGKAYFFMRAVPIVFIIMLVIASLCVVIAVAVLIICLKKIYTSRKISGPVAHELSVISGTTSSSTSSSPDSAAQKQLKVM